MADDLTVIAGIAGRRAEVLADELGVSTLADLAAQDVDTVVAALRRHRQAVAATAVAQWIAEAARRSARPEGWTLTTLFLVLFEHRAEQRRTVVRQVDTSEDAEWTGYVTTEPATWIAAQLDASASPQPPEAAEDAIDDDSARAVRSVHVRQPPGAAHALPADDRGNIARPLRAGAAFTVELEAVEDDVSEPALAITAYGAAEPVGTWTTTGEVATGAGFDVSGLPPGLYHLHASHVSQRRRRESPLVVVE